MIVSTSRIHSYMHDLLLEYQPQNGTIVGDKAKVKATGQILHHGSWYHLEFDHNGVTDLSTVCTLG